MSDFIIGFIAGMFAMGIPGFIFLLYAVGKAYNMGYEDALAEEDEEDFSLVVQDDN